jgi:nifR3 family TIM-barrel protein
MSSEARPTSAGVLASYAPCAGLDSSLRAFPRTGSVAERLAARPFLMAPMAGVSDAAYRLMARAGGAGLAYTEMVSVAGIHYGGDKTWKLVVPDGSEPDVAVQLFGSEPEQFREAAAAVAERLGGLLALLDVNMACPVPKVTRKGEGSALLDDPERAASIVRACVSEARVPVTVKIRSGRTADRPVAPEFARAMADAGASAVAVHGRSAAQLYRGKADWSMVARVARAVDVPVIGSGDVLDARSAAAMLAETGCAAAFVARGSYGDPWLFSDAVATREGRAPAEHGPDERLAAFECHVRLLSATGAHLARARSLAGWYLKGSPHAARLRDRAMSCVTQEDFLALVETARSEGARDAGR